MPNSTALFSSRTFVDFVTQQRLRLLFRNLAILILDSWQSLNLHLNLHDVERFLDHLSSSSLLFDRLSNYAT
jgi:hypothetical protein